MMPNRREPNRLENEVVTAVGVESRAVWNCPIFCNRAA
jgi:hypothetical protein